MAVTFEGVGDARGATTYNLPVEVIVVNEAENCRFSEEKESSSKFQELLDSIRQFGQKVPGEVRKDGKRAVLVSGHRRLRALTIVNRERKERGEPEYPFVATYVSANAETAFIDTVQENLGRKDLGVLDLSKTCGILANQFHKSEEEIGGIIGRTTSSVKKYLSVLTLSRKLQEKIDREGISADVAFMLAEAPEEEREKLLEEVQESGEKITGSSVQRKAREKGLLAAKKQRKLKDVKEFLESVKDGPVNSVYARRLAGAMLEYIGGDEGATDEKCLGAWDRNCKEEVKDSKETKKK
jgi:ParB/RepB/Spo0J family partition protein